MAIILCGTIGVLSLPRSQRTASQYIRGLLVIFVGTALCLVATIRYNLTERLHFLTSDWMIPTICLTTFLCVVITHVTLPFRKGKVQ